MSEDWLRYIRDPRGWSPPAPRPGPVHTERTTVRLFERGDGPKLFRAIDDSRDAILPWMIWATTDHLRAEDSIHYVEQSRRGYSRSDCVSFPMAIVERSSGEIIGGTGLHAIEPSLRQVEVGYWLRASHQRRGLCTEAIGALIAQILLPSSAQGWGLRRVIINVATDNAASLRICEKLGLRLEARFRAERYNGYPPDRPIGYHDTVMYAVLSDEWDHQGQRAKPNIGWDAT